MATATRTATSDLDRAVTLFHALSDATRLSILEMLRGGEQCVCDLQDGLDAAQSRLSFHLRVLREAGLVVDHLLGEFQTVIKPLGKVFSGVRFLSGSSILGNGDVALILDMAALLNGALWGNLLLYHYAANLWAMGRAEDAAVYGIVWTIAISLYLNGSRAGYTKLITGLAEALSDGSANSWDGQTYTTYGGQTRNGTIGTALNSDTLQQISAIATWALPFEALYQSGLHDLTADTTGVASVMWPRRSRRTLACVTSTPHFSQMTPRCFIRLYLPHRHS